MRGRITIVLGACLCACVSLLTASVTFGCGPESDSAEPDAADGAIDARRRDVADDEIPGAISDGGTDADAFPFAYGRVPFSCARADAGVDAGSQTLGHQGRIEAVVQRGDRILSAEGAGRGWILWSPSSGTEVAAATTGSFRAQAGDVFLAEDGAMRVRSMNDAAALATLPAGYGRYGLAIDGSYAWGASGSGIAAWSKLGAVLTTRAGNYASATVVGVSGELLVAGGPAGTATIEHVPTSGAPPTLGPAFEGTFHSWFTEGEGFLTKEGTSTLRIYDSAASLRGTIDVAMLPSDRIVGQRGHVWRHSAPFAALPTLDIYAIPTDGTPVLHREFSYPTSVWGVGGTVAVAPRTSGAPWPLELFLLDPTTGVTTETHALDVVDVTAFGATPTGEWALGTGRGLVRWGGAAAPALLGCGAITALAGSTSSVALLTAAGRVLVTDTSGARIFDLDAGASAIQISKPGNVLAMSHTASPGNPASSDLVALPSGALIRAVPKEGISLSPDGARVVTVEGSDWLISDVTTGDVIHTLSGIAGVSFSPDSRDMAVLEKSVQQTGPASFDPPVTAFWVNGVRGTTANISVSGWIDDETLVGGTFGMLVDDQANPYLTVVKVGFYGPSGASKGKAPLALASTFWPLDAKRVFFPHNATIMTIASEASYSTGLPRKSPAAGAGAVVVGPYLVAVVGRSLVAGKW